MWTKRKERWNGGMKEEKTNGQKKEGRKISNEEKRSQAWRGKKESERDG